MSISTNDTNSVAVTTGMPPNHLDPNHDWSTIPKTNERDGNPIRVPTMSNIATMTNPYDDHDDDEEQHQHQQQMMQHVYEQMQQQHLVLSNTVLTEMEQSSIENYYYRQKIYEQEQLLVLPNQSSPPKPVENTMNDMATSETMQQLLQSVDQLRNENDRLQEYLQKEMSIRHDALQRTKQVREEYSTVLQERDTEYRNLQTTWQQTSQQQYEKQLQLQHLLHQTQMKLQSIRTDRKILIETLQSTIQNNKNGISSSRSSSMKYEFSPPVSSSISSSDKVDLHRLLLDFKKQNASQVVTINTMMKVHDESDRMIKNAIEAKCKSENLLIKATHEQRRIMYENQSLLEEIQNLTEQLSVSRKKMESYADMANIERINKYKRTIEELKQQLKQQNHSKNVTNAVPMNLYRSVVVEAKQYANQVEQQRMAIHTLENHILQLEQERHQKHPHPQRSTTSMTSTNRAHSHQPSYPSILNQFLPSIISNAPYSSSAQIGSNGKYRPTIHSKQPRPKTPLPKKVPMKNNYVVSPTVKVSSHDQQLQPLIKSALKKKKTANELFHPNRIESTTTNVSNNKVVHFNCNINVTETTKKDRDKIEQSLETTTTPYSGRRNVESSGPTPSRLDYALLSTNATKPMTDDKVTTAITPNTKESQITRSQIRLSAVRAHGGRMGLQEKLRQVRRKNNVDEITAMCSPPLERKSPTIQLPLNSRITTLEVEPTKNKIVRNVSINITNTNNTANKENSNRAVAAAEVATTELESYNTKLERMRIRPRQMGK